MDTLGSRSSVLRWILRIASLSFSTGRSTRRRRGSRRSEASSRSKGRLVATMMKAESSVMPSHSRRNWLMSSR